MNVTSVGFLGNYLKTGMPLISKRVTYMAGPANPQNVIVPIGTKISDVIAFCGGYKEEAKKIILGGPDHEFRTVLRTSIRSSSRTTAFWLLTRSNPGCSSPAPASTAASPPRSLPHASDAQPARKNTPNKDTDELKDLSVMTCMDAVAVHSTALQAVLWYTLSVREKRWTKAERSCQSKSGSRSQKSSRASQNGRLTEFDCSTLRKA